MPEWADEVRARLASLRLAPTREAEIVEELSQHLDDRYHELIAGGASPDEAQRAALAALRSSAALAQHLTPLRQAQAPPPITPGATSGHALGDLWQDARHAMRMFVRQRGFAAAVILTLALGIGANTAIFSVVYAALLQPLPYETPDQLYSVEVVIPDRREMSSVPVRVQDYLEWSRAETVFSAVAALTPGEWNLTGDGEPQRVGAARVSTNFFATLGVPPAHGRTFLPEEQQPGRDRVAIISDALWRSRFAANPAVLRSTIVLNGDSFVVVGIAPPTLLVPTGPSLHTALPFAPRIDVWIPIAPTPRDLEGENWNHGLIVRLKAGESLERGRLQLQSMLNASLRAAMPDMKTEFQTRVVPLREIYSGQDPRAAAARARRRRPAAPRGLHECRESVSRAPRQPRPGVRDPRLVRRVAFAHRLADGDREHAARGDRRHRRHCRCIPRCWRPARAGTGRPACAG